MILAVVRLKVLTVKRKELQQTLQSLAAQMKTETGCLDSNLYRLVEDENNFALIGTWENRKALDDHLQSNRFTVLMGARGLLSRSPEIMIHTVSQSSELRAGHLTK